MPGNESNAEGQDLMKHSKKELVQMINDIKGISTDEETEQLKKRVDELEKHSKLLIIENEKIQNEISDHKMKNIDLEKANEELKSQLVNTDVFSEDEYKQKILELEKERDQYMELSHMKRIGIPDELPDHVKVVPRLNIHFWAIVSKENPKKVIRKVSSKDEGDSLKKPDQEITFVSLFKPGHENEKISKDILIPKELAIEYFNDGNVFWNEEQFNDYLIYPEVFKAGRTLVPITGQKKRDKAINTPMDLLSLDED